MKIDALYAMLAGRCDVTRQGTTIAVDGSLNLNDLTTLPEGVTLTAGGGLDLNSLTELPKGVTITSGGGLFLGRLKTLPKGVTITSGGGLYLGRLTTLPGGVTLTSGGYLYLSSLTELAAGVTLTAGGGLNLRSLTELAAGVTLTAGEYLDLGRLTALPKGVTLTAGGTLFLSSLTTLPEGVTITADGDLYLDSLAALPEDATLSAKMVYGQLNQTWQGRTLRSIDGIVMQLVGATHVVGAATVQAARYFGRPEGSEVVYIATVGEHTAHGETAEEAIEDAIDKGGLVDPTQVIAEIKAAGLITREQYRVLTGACREGVRQWCTSHGVTDSVESLSLAEVMRMTAGQYGGDRLVELLG